MKFCDKLAKLRKENNLSQEQFADKMNVSRQAVSKWESGSSYPDMDKILTMCKILNCKLDDLLDDGVIGNNYSNKKVNINDYIKDFFEFITKTYNMFWSMTFLEKIKCLFEMFVIFCILLILGLIVHDIIYNLFFINLVNIIGIGFVVKNIINPIFVVFLIILGTIIFIHLFKIRYLNYFVTIFDEDVKEKTKEEALKEEKIIDNKRYIVQDKKEKIVIRDPKHSSLGFLNILLKIVIYIIKFFVIIFIIPFIMFTVFEIALSTFSIFLISNGIIFFYAFIIGLGAVLISYIIIYFAYNFIFNKEIKFKIMFILFIVGLSLLGIGSGLFFLETLNFEYKSVSDVTYKKYTKTIDMEDNLVFTSAYDINYVIDDSLNDIKIDVNVPKYSDFNFSKHKSDEYMVYHIYSDCNINKLYKTVLNDLKHKKLRSYENDMDVNIYLSKENYDKIENNNN